MDSRCDRIFVTNMDTEQRRQNNTKLERSFQTSPGEYENDKADLWTKTEKGLVSSVAWGNHSSVEGQRFTFHASPDDGHYYHLPGIERCERAKKKVLYDLLGKKINNTRVTGILTLTGNIWCMPPKSNTFQTSAHQCFWSLIL